jgi:hypothetical protein
VRRRSTEKTITVLWPHTDTPTAVVDVPTLELRDRTYRKNPWRLTDVPVRR